SAPRPLRNGPRMARLGAGAGWTELPADLRAALAACCGGCPATDELRRAPRGQAPRLAPAEVGLGPGEQGSPSCVAAHHGLGCARQPDPRAEEVVTAHPGLGCAFQPGLCSEEVVTTHPRLGCACHPDPLAEEPQLSRRSIPASPFCAKIVRACRLVSGPGGSFGAQPFEDIRDLLGPVWGSPILSYSELRFPFLAARFLELPAPLGLYHVAVLLDVEGPQYAISIEKWEDRIEVMLGERGALCRGLERCRSGGEPRGAPAGSMVVLPSVRVGAASAEGPRPRVADLYRWLAGPVASGWRPYDLLHANCQHFCGDLVGFLGGAPPP
ncbi:unnamed protein product, partial [Prorocentrum cordatum]